MNVIPDNLHIFMIDPIIFLMEYVPLGNTLPLSKIDRVALKNLGISVTLNHFTSASLSPLKSFTEGHLEAKNWYNVAMEVGQITSNQSNPNGLNKIEFVADLIKYYD